MRLPDYLVAIAIFLVALCCCNVIDSPNAGTPPTQPLRVDTQTTLGAQGGAVSTEGMTLTIPPGMFSSSTTITVNRSTEPWAYSEVAATPLYSVTLGALPQGEQRLQFSFAADAMDSADGYQVFVGYPSLDSAGLPETTFVLCDSAGRTDDTISGSLTASFTSSLSKRTAIPAVVLPAALIVGAVKFSYYKNSVAGNFRAYGHWALTTPPDALLADLESAWEKLEAMGFDMSKWRATKNWPWWPFRCYIYPSNVLLIGMTDNSYAYFRPNWVTRNFDEIGINARYITRSNTMRVSLGHEFFHAIQSCYLNEDYTSYRWFMEASSAWFETKMGTAGWIPTTIINSPKFYKDGLEGVTATDKAFHGYPHFLFVAYLAGICDEKLISDIWKNIQTRSGSDKSATAAIADVLYTGRSLQLANVYRDFVKAFVQGQILSHWRSGSDLATEKQWTISKTDIENNTQKIVSADFPDMSTRIVTISFAPDVKDVPLNTPYKLTMSPVNGNCIVYLFDDDVAERPIVATIDAANPVYTIPSVTEYAGKNLLAVIVNTTKTNTSFTGKTAITFSNGVNYLDGSWTWTIVPITDGCKNWPEGSEVFTIKLSVVNNTLMMLNTQDDEPIPASSFTVAPPSIIIRAGVEADGFIIGGTIIDQNKWRATLTIDSYITDHETNIDYPCQSTATVEAVRIVTP